MTRVVNLNRVRKSRTREAEKTQAHRNSVAFGRTKAERDRVRAVAEKLRVALEAHRREE